ncbi:MAG: hypothetical protein ACPL4E_07725 [Thermoproteota archaeon]
MKSSGHMAFRRMLKRLEPSGGNIYGFFPGLKAASLMGQPGGRLYEHFFG